MFLKHAVAMEPMCPYTMIVKDIFQDPTQYQASLAPRRLYQAQSVAARQIFHLP